LIGILLTKHLTHPALGDRDKLSAFEGILRAFIDGTGAFLIELRRPGSGFVEGEAWAKLVRGLTEHCRRNRLPYKVSKDRTKTARPHASPFVRLVKSLQLIFPEGAVTRHTHSDVALEGAISRARRDVRRRPVRDQRPAGTDTDEALPLERPDGT
jgi:hypothetical protein